MTNLSFRVHAIQRMFDRGISTKTVRQVLRTGEIIEDYTSEMHEPGRLILGFRDKQPIHVVAAENEAVGEIVVVTVYVPDADHWTKDFRSRKS